MICVLLTPPVPALVLFPYQSKINRALALAEMSQKHACIVMDRLDESEFCKQMAGTKNHHLSFQRLLMLPLSFWSGFLPSLAEHFGFRCESQDAMAAATSRLLESCADVMRLATISQDQQKKKGGVA